MEVINNNNNNYYYYEMGGSYWYEYLASCMPQRPNITVQETQAWSKIPEKIAFYKTIGTVGR